MAKEYNISSSKKSIGISRIFVRYWGLINAALMFFVMAGGGFFILKPKYQAARAAAGTDSLIEEVENARRSLKSMNAMSEAFAEISEEDKKRIAAIIPYNENSESLFPLIETLVQKNGLMIASLELEEEEKNPSARPEESGEAAGEEGGPAADAGKEESLPSEIKKVGMNLTVGGADYKALKNLIESLENNLRLLDVTEVIFGADENASLKIYAYFLER